MASEIASNMSMDDKDSMEGMDIEKMISHVTKNMFKMMDNNDTINNNTNNRIQEYSDDSEKTNDLEFLLKIGIDDLYTGKKKKLSVKVKTIDNNTFKKKLIVNILPGMKDGDIITFPGEADECEGKVPGDVIIKIVEVNDTLFKRDGDDLIFHKDITVDQIFSNKFVITHLDSRKLTIQNNENILKKIKKVKGEGMPIKGSKEKYGDMFIHFNILIPEKRSLSLEELETLRELINNNEENESEESSTE